MIVAAVLLTLLLSHFAEWIIILIVLHSPRRTYFGDYSAIQLVICDVNLVQNAQLGEQVGGGNQRPIDVKRRQQGHGQSQYLDKF